MAYVGARASCGPNAPSFKRQHQLCQNACWAGARSCAISTRGIITQAALPHAANASNRRLQLTATRVQAAAAAPEAPPAVKVPKPVTSVLRTPTDPLPSSLGSAGEYEEAEAAFTRLLNTEDLDQHLWSEASDASKLRQDVQKLEQAVGCAIEAAYSAQNRPQTETSPMEHQAADGAAHTFLQRILYRINRMALFWFDDLRNYSNERSVYLAELRDSIEGPWQAWELAQMDVAHYRSMTPQQLKDALERQSSHDVDPPPSPSAQYMQEEMSLQGYRHLLAVASVDGLVEASRQSRVCGGAANEVSCMVFRVLMEEYGCGRYSKKHSTFFATMMQQLDLRTEPEWYFDLVPWQSLAGMNHNFLLTERRRHYLRYCGGLTFFEVAGPSIYRTYLAAAERLGLGDDASGYWALHITEDERHGRQMVHDVALPLVNRYHDSDAWEILLGYDQEKFIGERAGAALIDDLKAVDQRGHTPAADM